MLRYFRSVPREQLPNSEGSLSVVDPPAAIRASNRQTRSVFTLAKWLIFRGTTVARKLNPQILTVMQPKWPPRKFSPTKNTRYTVSITDLPTSTISPYKSMGILYCTFTRHQYIPAPLGQLTYTGVVGKGLIRAKLVKYSMRGMSVETLNAGRMYTAFGEIGFLQNGKLQFQVIYETFYRNLHH